jgi:hypothetical protein
MNRTIIAATIVTAFLMGTAEAKRTNMYTNVHSGRMVPNNDGKMSFAVDGNGSPVVRRTRHIRAAEPARERRVRVASIDPTEIGHPSQGASVGRGVVLHGRPAGCPHRYCGCEASLYLFGKVRSELNLASNWMRKFPSASPAPGMAAARSGHVMVLVSHVSGDQWIVHDGNSGRGLTREHIRSIRGYRIVNPRGAA